MFDLFFINSKIEDEFKFKFIEHLLFHVRMNEFKINEFITLKLEDKKTNIYVNNKLFQQCVFLLISIPSENEESLRKVDSVDDAAELLDPTLEEVEGYHYNIPPETEFWAHCSNIQVWHENAYNTKLLHSSLAFSLLKKLSESGDPLAKKKYKEEIAERFIYGNRKIQDFLLDEGYLDALSREEIFSLVRDSDILTKLETSFGSPLKINTMLNPHPYGFVIENGAIKWLSLNNCGLSKVPEIIREFKSLEGLTLRRNVIEILPEWIGDFKQLEFLDIANNQLKEIPESVGNLQGLRQLKLQHNKLKRIPCSIGNLNRLEMLFANDNIIETLPESIGRLISLNDFVIGRNSLKSIPESIGYMSSLKNLDIRENPIKELPDSILYIKNLKSLNLKGLKGEFSSLVNNLRRKKVNVLK